MRYCRLFEVGMGFTTSHNAPSSHTIETESNRRTIHTDDASNIGNKCCTSNRIVVVNPIRSSSFLSLKSIKPYPSMSKKPPRITVLNYEAKSTPPGAQLFSKSDPHFTLGHGVTQEDNAKFSWSKEHPTDIVIAEVRPLQLSPPQYIYSILLVATVESFSLSHYTTTVVSSTLHSCPSDDGDDGDSQLPSCVSSFPYVGVSYG